MADMNQHRPTGVSRRTMLQTLALGSAGVALPGPLPAHALQAPTAENPSFSPLNRFPRMVQEFFVARENELHRQRLQTLSELTTKADAEAYVLAVRGKIRDSFGPFPEKTPLNARVTKVVERDTY